MHTTWRDRVHVASVDYAGLGHRGTRHTIAFPCHEEHPRCCITAEGEEPSSVDEALQVKEWHEAMKEELVSIEENKTWSLVHMPKGHHTIGPNWIFKLKRDEHNNVVRHKGRLITKGYIQKVFAPVARMESVRIVLAIATHCGWQVHHMDVKSAFLNGD
jgi:hypothetical protein